MKTRKTAASKNKMKTAATPAGQPKRKLRKRTTGVRSKVLDLLATGPMTSSDLVAKGGFSAASLYLNLKSLKKDGLIKTARNGRSVSISLSPAARAAAEAPIEGEVLPPPKPTAKPTVALVSAYVPRDLHEALEGLARRLSPVDRLEEKLMVLEQLSRTMPAPVAAVLQETMADLVRLSTDHSS